MLLSVFSTLAHASWTAEIVQSGVAPYDKYMNLTAPCNRAWAEEHGYPFTAITERRIGALDKACGNDLSLAAFNKLEMLVRKSDARHHGLVLYMDADAVVTSPRDVIADMIAEGGSDALVWAQAGGSRPLQKHPWDINNGVFLWNLSHPQSDSTIREWHRAAISRQCFRTEGIRDQRLMHEALRTRDYAVRKITTGVTHFVRSATGGTHNNWNDEATDRRYDAIFKRVERLRWCHE